MKFRKLIFILLILSFCISLKAQYQPQHPKEMYLEELPEQNNKIVVDGMLSALFLDINFDNLFDFLDSYFQNSDLKASCNLDYSNIEYNEAKKIITISFVGNFSLSNRIDEDIATMTFTAQLRPDEIGRIYITLKDFKFKVPTSKTFVPAEELISDRVALTADRTALMADKADYRMASCDFFADQLNCFVAVIMQYLEEHEKQIEPIPIKLRIIDPDSPDIDWSDADSISIESSDIDWSEGDTIKDYVISGDWSDTVSMDTLSSQLKTNFGYLSVMPYYTSYLEDIDLALNEILDEKDAFLITNSGEIVAIKITSQMITENGRSFIHIRTEDIGDSDFLMNLAKDEYFTISNVTIASKEFQSKLKALAKKRKFSLQDLEKMELSPIATAHGAVTVDEVPEVLECRRASDVQLDTNNESANLLIEVVDIWGHDN